MWLVCIYCVNWARNRQMKTYLLNMWPKQWTVIWSHSYLLLGFAPDSSSSSSRQWWIEAVTQWWTSIAAVWGVSHWSQAVWFQSRSRSNHPMPASWMAGDSNKIGAMQDVGFSIEWERLRFLFDRTSDSCKNHLKIIRSVSNVSFYLKLKFFQHN